MSSSPERSGDRRPLDAYPASPGRAGSMRTQLARPLLATAVATALAAAALAAYAAYRFATADPEVVSGLPDRLSTQHGLGLLVFAMVVPLLVGAVVAGLLAWHEARRLTVPMTALAEQAEALGQGESRINPLASGVPELDRVSMVLARSARSMKRSLATERDFASDASHQLRTPLTALLMRLEEINAAESLDTVREEAGLAISQVERLTTTVDGLLARTRGTEAGRPVVSLDSIIATLQRDWQPQFARSRRSVHVDGERGVFVRGAPVALNQLFSVLLENALKHGEGTVTIRVRRAGPTVVVEVGDQGQGVPLALAPHIFERSVSSGGTGLGLALARDLAEAQGGRLELIQARPAVFAAFLSESR